jgi:serine/threonine protein kinase
MVLTSGSKLGPYEIQSPLGAGGMGQVYRARDTRLDRTVAIKILPTHLSDNPEAKQRFEREARSISSLNHPNICTLYDVGQQDGVDFLVMEFLEGETLADRLMKGPLPPEQVLKYGVEICEGLEKAHRTGIIHRDLKPGNVMLTKAGAKLMDFGLAKATTGSAAPSSSLTMTLSRPSSDQPLTAQGMVVGTFQYMPPEQVEGKEADVRSDLFALGAVLYEMATGKRAFEGKTTASVIAAVLERDPAPISAVQPMSPPPLDRVVKTCLAKDPEERFQNVHDVKVQLKWIAEGGSQAGVPAPVAAHRKNRERLSWAASSALLVLCLALAAAYFGRPSPERRVVRSSILPPEKSMFALAGTFAGPAVVSPDGRRLAFGIIGADAKQVLYVRSLNALSGQVLAGTEGATYPFWSADSRFLGFFADGQLKKVDASGGPVQVLCAAPEGRGGSWNRDGTILFAPTFTSALFRVAAAGGVPIPATKLDDTRQESSHRWPQFLPDGRHFIYLTRRAALSESGINAGSLDSPQQVPVLDAASNAVYAPPGYLLFVRNSALVAQPFDAKLLRVTGDPIPIAEQVEVNGGMLRATFSVSENGVLAYARSAGAGSSQLIWMDRNGKQLGTGGGRGAYFGPSLSPDGHKLAVEAFDVQSSGRSDLWVFDLLRGVRTRLTFNPSDRTVRSRQPRWSPDGSHIVFTSSRSGHNHIYEKSANGVGNDELLLQAEGDQFATSWSADGRFIAYVSLSPQAGGMGQIRILPTFGDHKPFPFLQGEPGVTVYSFPSFSPDGKWVAYQSNESGQGEVYISRFPSGAGKWQVSTNGGNEPVWRRDGKELYYLGIDDKLIAAEITEQKDSLVVGAVRPLFQAHPVLSANLAYDVSPDGKRFLINSLINESASEPITLVVNWDAELRK